jgi:outer membrane biosynthesis protein TonB
MFIGKLKNENHTIHTNHKNKTKIIDNEKQKEINSPTNERPKLSVSSSTNNTHKTVPDTIKIYEESEVKRAFLPLSNSQLIEFLTKNFKYPSIPPINGKGKVDLVIERDGRVSDVIIVQSIHPEIDKEFVRILKLLPKFTPGSINGISVRSKYRVPTTSVCK